MIIDLKKAAREPIQVHVRLDESWWDIHGEAESQILGVGETLRLELEIVSEEGKFTINGHMEGVLSLRCDRCLEAYPYTVDADFVHRVCPSMPQEGREEIELLDDDIVDFIDEYELNLDDFAIEQIFLSLPIKSICREDCSGLCPVCGTNLNLKECSCVRVSGHPGFSRLKDLKL